MSNFNFYKADKAYGELFLQFPKVFLYSKKYKNLSNDAKIAYMVFKDRLQYSLKNNWIDSENNVYFIFTNEEICKMLGKSKPTVIKIKKELEEIGLLLQVQQGFNPRKKRNEPNRLYMADLEVDATDIYTYQHVGNQTKSLGTSGSKNSLPRQDNNKSVKPYDMSGSKNSLPRPEISKSLDTSGSKNSLLNQYKELSSKDSKDIKEIPKIDKTHYELISDSFKEKDTETENQLIETYIKENHSESYYGRKLIQEIKKMSRSDFATFTAYMNKLEFAQKSVETEEELSIPMYENNQYGEYTSDQLVSTFNRCMYQFRFGKVENIESYLFMSFKTVFKDLALAIKQSNASTD